MITAFLLNYVMLFSDGCIVIAVAGLFILLMPTVQCKVNFPNENSRGSVAITCAALTFSFAVFNCLPGP